MRQTKANWGKVVAAGVLAGFGGMAQATGVPGQGTWETTLQGRDLDGNLGTFEAYYDTDLNITWLADAYYGGTIMNWATANDWAAGLNPYGSGITGWRLPTTVDDGNDGATYTNLFQGVDYGYNITTHSEMSHLYYVTLGNMAYYDTSGVAAQPGWGLTNTGSFSNIWYGYYWSATEYAPDTSNAWLFTFGEGRQDVTLKTESVWFAWAVHDGDVSAVPVPAAVWLFGSGVMGLLGWGRRKAGTLVLG